VLFSRKEAVLVELRAIEIHGAAFYDIVFTVTEMAGARPESARIGGEMMYPNARVGDRILVEKVANVVARVEKM
jgi:signal peptidase I